MSEKKLDLGALVNNSVGHPLARALAEGLWDTQLIRRFASQSPEMMSFISKGVMAVTSLLEVGGDHPIARFGNYLAETLATENVELLKQFRENPDDPKIAKEFQEAVDAKIKKAGEDVYVALHHIHKDEKCLVLVDYLADATPPGRPGKDGKTFSNPSGARIRGPLPLENALAVTTALCSKCYPATSVRKPEDAQKAKEVVAGRNFMEHVWRLRKEEPHEFEKFWTAYLLRLEGPDGDDLARKFQDVFNGKFGYEAFREIVRMPHRNEHGSEEWHHALDALLGKVTSPETWKKWAKGFVDEEKRQTEEMFRALFAWLEKSNAKRAENSAARRARIAALDASWEADRKARKTGKTVRKIVFLGLLVILAGWFTIQRVTDAPARSDQSEQKEISHEH